MRTILHSDLNNFYASVETLKHPEYKGVPLAVCGSVEDRHGIVLAKNQLAKSFGVKTGEVLWQAKKKCKNLQTVEANHRDYEYISKKVRKIYERFTDCIEPFGIDECWLDVTHSLNLFGSGEQIAEQIRRAVKEEIGITVSVGVSFNKVFAKLGSDMKKPDAVTAITPENYKQLVWRLPVQELLYVGNATRKKLNGIGIHTIGELATTDQKILKRLLGVWGENLYRYANGLDDSPVEQRRDEDTKSIGNSLTDYKDLLCMEEVRILLLHLSESVAMRLRESGLGKAKTVKLTVTDNQLNTFGKQTKLLRPTSSAVDIARTAYKLFESLYKWDYPVRGAGVSVSDFTLGAEQLMIGLDGKCDDDVAKSDRLDEAVDKIRKKYGNISLQRARILQDRRLSETEVKGNTFLKDGEQE
jgi:DNA polymerase-4